MHSWIYSDFYLKENLPKQNKRKQIKIYLLQHELGKFFCTGQDKYFRLWKSYISAKITQLCHGSAKGTTVSMSKKGHGYALIKPFFFFPKTDGSLYLTNRSLFADLWFRWYSPAKEKTPTGFFQWLHHTVLSFVILPIELCIKQQSINLSAFLRAKKDIDTRTEFSQPSSWYVQQRGAHWNNEEWILVTSSCIDTAAISPPHIYPSATIIELRMEGSWCPSWWKTSTDNAVDLEVVRGELCLHLCYISF